MFSKTLVSVGVKSFLYEIYSSDFRLFKPVERIKIFPKPDNVEKMTIADVWEIKRT